MFPAKKTNLEVNCLKAECKHLDHTDTFLKKLWSKALPAILKGFSIEDYSLICTCGHWINAHENGLDGGISFCQEDEGFCGCMYPEIDLGETIRENYFYKNNNRIRVNKFISSFNFTKVWSDSLHGLPLFTETDPIPFKEKVTI